MTNKSQQNDDQHSEFQSLLKSGFQSIEKDIDDHTPSQQWFEQFVENQQTQLKAKFKRDVILFLIAACCILAVFSITLLQMPTLFLILQGIIFVVAAIISSVTYVKQVKKI